MTSRERVLAAFAHVERNIVPRWCGAFGLLQQLLPESYTNTAKWSDIFSDARLYRTHRVETTEGSR